MSPRLLDARTDVALRRLDPARPTSPSETSRTHATALLDRIVATDPGTDHATPGLGVSGHMDGTRLALLLPAARSRSVRRVALAGIAAAILAAGAIVLPGRSPNYAYADWTAAPTPVTTHDASRAAAACRESVGTIGDGGRQSFPAASRLATRLVERRGAWVLVFLSATTAGNASCIVHLPSGSDGPPVVVNWAGGGDGGWPAPAGAELTPGGVAEFGPTEGLEALIRGAPRHSKTFSTTSGHVGGDVVGVTIHAGGRTVEASVANGTYAAWWPGPAFDPATTGAPSGEGGPEPALSYDLTLRDGSVRRDIVPTYGGLRQRPPG